MDKHTKNVLIVLWLVSSAAIWIGIYLYSQNYFDTWQDKKAEIVKTLEDKLKETIPPSLAKDIASCLATKIVDAAQAEHCPLRVGYSAAELLTACLMTKPGFESRWQALRRTSAAECLNEISKKQGDK
jgi:predicted helicase